MQKDAGHMSWRLMCHVKRQEAYVILAWIQTKEHCMYCILVFYACMLFCPLSLALLCDFMAQMTALIVAGWRITKCVGDNRVACSHATAARVPWGCGVLCVFFKVRSQNELPLWAGRDG